MEKACALNKKEWLDAIDLMKSWTGDKMRAFSLSPYWIHPIRVATLVAKYKQSHRIDWIILAALMHDVVEDTSHTVEEIAAIFGMEPAALVNELTSDDDAIIEQGKTLTDDSKLWKRLGKAEYLARKLVKMSSWALVIKLCDRLDNVSDFCLAPQDFIEKYAAETDVILLRLETEREQLSDTHKRIIKDIRATMAIYRESKFERVEEENNDVERLGTQGA